MIGPSLLLKEIRRRELWPQLQERLKFNECHNPPGSPEGGEFCSGSGGASASDTGMTQYSALYDYQNYAHAKINDDLRSGATSPAHEAYVAALDQSFEAVPERQHVLWRGDGAGLSVAMTDKNPLPADFKINASSLTFPSQRAAINAQLSAHFNGMIFEDKAYLSTSASQAIAMEKFVSVTYDISRYGGSGLVEISGRMRALDIDKITKMGAKEKERLLPRGLKLRVNGVSAQLHPDGKRVYLHWKVSVVK